jgi:hypothetical protein
MLEKKRKATKLQAKWQQTSRESFLLPPGGAIGRLPVSAVGMQNHPIKLIHFGI